MANRLPPNWSGGGPPKKDLADKNLPLRRKSDVAAAFQYDNERIDADRIRLPVPHGFDSGAMTFLVHA